MFFSPRLPPPYAIYLSIFYTILFVSLLYLRRATRTSPSMRRDHPIVIRKRAQAVTAATGVSLAISYFVARWYCEMDTLETLHVLGLWPVRGWECVKAVGLTMVLFAGPLVEWGWFENGDGSDWEGFGGVVREVRDTLGSSVGFRNLVVGPVTEELTFRSAILAIHLLTPSTSSTSSPRTLIFLTPLYFGLAHFHHLYEFTVTNPQVPLSMGILRSVFQFSFTSLFGWYASFLYLRFGSVYAAILVHSFCNIMGPPRVWGKVQKDYGVGEREVAWRSIAYYIVLVGGAVGFWKNVWKWTESGNALVQMG